MRQWPRSVRRQRKATPQMSQPCFFSPVWMLRCSRRYSDLLKYNLHTCSTVAAHLQHTCSTAAAHLQHTCSTAAEHLRHTCSTVVVAHLQCIHRYNPLAHTNSQQAHLQHRCTHKYKHTDTHTHKHTNINTNTNTHTHTNTNTRARPHAHIHTHTCTRVLRTFLQLRHTQPQDLQCP